MLEILIGAGAILAVCTTLHFIGKLVFWWGGLEPEDQLPPAFMTGALVMAGLMIILVVCYGIGSEILR